MSLFRSSRDNYSGESLTNIVADNSSSILTSTPRLDQNDNSTSPMIHIGGHEELPTSVPIYTLSCPSDWFRLLKSILFIRGQNSILACLSLLYIIIRLPLAAWSIYQIYCFAIGSAVEGVAVMAVVFLMWVLEKETGLEKMCWDVLVEMGGVCVAMERGKRDREVKRLARWKERQRFEREERGRVRDGWDWDGRHEDGDIENDSLQVWIGETSMVRDDNPLFFEGEESDTTKLL